MSSGAVSMADQRRRNSRLLALEVIKILRAMGGSAHADAIFEILRSRRQQQGREAPDSLRKSIRDVLSLFEASGDGAADRPLFHRPFGPGSNRWALRDDAIGADLSLNVIEEVEAILGDHAIGHRSPDGIESARRRVIAMLGEGPRFAAVDLMVLDELERRGAVSHLGVLH